MNVFALASRVVARRRRLLLRSAIPMGIAAFAAVVTLSVLQSVAADVRETERTEISGELSSRRATGPHDLSGLAAIPSSDDLLISNAWVTVGFVASADGDTLAEIWFTDISQELAFRGKTASGGGVSTSTVILPGIGSVPSSGTIPIWARGMPVLLMPWDSLPGDEAGEEAPGAELIRVRGRRPLDTNTVEQLRAATGLDPTGWKALAGDRLRDLWLLGAVLVGLLFAAGAAATAPSIGIAARKLASEFALLWTMGYRRSFLRWLVVDIGVLVSGLAAGIGAAAGGIVVTIIAARGGLDPSLLPLYWLESNPEISRIIPGSPLLSIAMSVGVGLALGGISALPATRVPATMGRCGNLWR